MLNLRKLVYFIPTGVFLGIILTGCSKTGIEHGMENQPKANPLTQSDFFPDGRSSRMQVPGTVARGHLRDDTLLYTGKVGEKDSEIFPFPITREVLERGHERYDIFCAVCHGRTGAGDGIVVRRGFKAPTSYHDERLRGSPIGHFFDVMTNGYGTMFSYADRVSVEDRWAIAAYIRALQLSQHATAKDVPAKDRAALENTKPTL